MQRKFALILLLGLVLTAVGCQSTGTIPFISKSAGLPAQSE